ncbi:MAG: UDP-N-acetylmuramate--L-alanine ligase [Bacteroidales bacterium]|nr:UDP-N-acetylmuramate--L-alanine ligase [Bacteroidales bacterium]MCL2738514.1 UDP-N-acetylmuramate--L-alanine ligase [Bacteroidales bacterium]
MFKQIYFLGIGGIGMSALARYFAHAGAYVAGYDRCPSSLTLALEQEGMDIHYEDNPDFIPPSVLNRPQDTLVIYTPAIPPDHLEWNYLKQKGYPIIKRSKALGQIADTKICLAVAGSHGKTTTSTLLAHIFCHSGKGCTAFLGGISKNYQSNLLLSHSPYLVAEADEFDRSFLQLHPQTAVITSIDPDHLDIYGDYAQVEQAFVDFAAQIKQGGSLVLKQGLPFPLPAEPAYTVYRYALDHPADFYASRLVWEEGGYYRFNLHLAGHTLEDCRLGIAGRINIENAVAASAIAFLHDIPPQDIASALACFSGVARRFDIQFDQAGCTYIDDYAHHPAELTAALQSIRSMYPERKITAVFQPHLYTRTRDFADDFGLSLNLADELILLPIYPAREEPISGISSEMLLGKVSLKDKWLIAYDDLVAFLKNHSSDVLVSLGAGDIDRLVPLIKTMLEEKT